MDYKSSKFYQDFTNLGGNNQQFIALETVNYIKIFV